jgi:hypothetical protein
MKVSSHFDQYLAAGIFPPFPASRCACVSMRGRPRQFVTTAVTFGPLRPLHQQPTAVVGYAVLVPAERIARQKRHGSTAAELDVFLLGGTNVIS